MRGILSVRGRASASLSRAAILLAGVSLFAIEAHALDTTWQLNPSPAGDWNTAGNWTAGVPGIADTAIFGASSVTTISGTTTAGAATARFEAAAPEYSFVFGNAGQSYGFSIVNNSSFAPRISMLGGQFSIGGTGTAANAIMTLNGSGSALFYGNASAGTATIHVLNGTGVAFQGSSTAANATFNVNNLATVAFTDTSTAGNATLATNTNNALVTFSDSASGGSARLVAGLGNFRFDLLTTGGTTAGSIEGAGSFLLGSRTLTVGSNNLSTEVSGLVAGVGGSLIKVGTGTLTLSGANSYNGSTFVNAGTLNVSGSTASSQLTMVNAGGTLGGNGIVGHTTIDGGTLAPGNSIGLLTVQGSLVMTAASSYMVEVSPANADRVNVTGTATLGGATVNALFAPGSYVARRYTILNSAGGRIGTFGALVNDNLPSNLSSSLSYDANNVYLDLALNFAVPGGLNRNQQNVGNALTNFFNSTGGIPLNFASLSPAGLTQASGEAGTGSQQTTFDAMGLFMGVMTDPFIAGRGDTVNAGATPTAFADASDGISADASNDKSRSNSERDAYAAVWRKASVADAFAQRWSVWAAGYGGSQTTDGTAVVGSNTATSRIYGTAVGADYRFSPDTLAGFALAGAGTSFSIANGLGSGRSDLFQVGAFIRHTVGPAYISAALAYGWQDITTDRTVTIAGIDRLRAQFNANAWSGRVEGGYRFVSQGLGFTPYAAAQFVTFELPNYSEAVVSGANTFALAYAAKSVTATRSELGLRTDKSFAMQNGIFTLRGRAAWAHDFNPDRTVTPTFQTVPGASFVVNGAAQARNAALTTASAEMKWLNGWSAAATFEGEFSDVTRSYAGKGVVRYAW